MEEDFDRLVKELDACEADCKKPKEVGLAPKSGPSDTGVALGARVGAALPLGSAEQNDDLSDGIALGIPIMLEGGYRFGPGIVVGAYLGWGPLFTKHCPDAASCSAWDLRFGLKGEYHLRTLPNIDPWVGLGTGWEILHGSQSAGSVSTSSSLSGFEFVTLQGGADFVLAPSITGGPFLSFSLGEYSNASVSGGAGGDASASIPNKALHEWLTIGFRAAYDIPLH
jgi:hypothetical protein